MRDGSFIVYLDDGMSNDIGQDEYETILSQLDAYMGELDVQEIEYELENALNKNIMENIKVYMFNGWIGKNKPKWKELAITQIIYNNDKSIIVCSNNLQQKNYQFKSNGIYAVKIDGESGGEMYTKPITRKFRSFNAALKAYKNYRFNEYMSLKNDNQNWIQAETRRINTLKEPASCGIIDEFNYVNYDIDKYSGDEDDEDNTFMDLTISLIKIQ